MHYLLPLPGSATAADRQSIKLYSIVRVSVVVLNP